MVKKKEEKIKTLEDVDEEFLEETGQEPSLDFMGLLKDPAMASLLESGKDLFKKEKADPDVCEITIKAPSEVVLKLFQLTK